MRYDANVCYGEKGIFYFVNHIQNSIDAICIIAWVSHGEIENRPKLFNTHIYTHAEREIDYDYIDMSIEFPNIFRSRELLLNVHFLHSLLTFATTYQPQNPSQPVPNDSWIGFLLSDFLLRVFFSSSFFHFISFSYSCDQHCIFVHFLMYPQR